MTFDQLLELGKLQKVLGSIYNAKLHRTTKRGRVMEYLQAGMELLIEMENSGRSIVKEPFDEWAIVELFGHQKVAGKVTAQTIGGTQFIRVDVPEIKSIDLPKMTKFYQPGAIYTITIEQGD